MNSMMNIQIRVLSVQAQKQIRAMEVELATLRKQVAATNAASAGFGASGIKGITRWGNQIQWAGRQLQYNFTLPIVLAGGLAAKFALDNEKAMVRVQKVYGDTTMSAQQMKSETKALGRAFKVLSDTFAVNQAETINIAADWAAAGASGVALAKSTKLTMQTMILGEMEAKEATEALIAIQAQYGQSVDELSRTIDVLNMVENQTGISMQGLVQGFSRAAGVARSAGINVEHLAAMMAALTPAAGSAANAGNALKTIISRLLSPTAEAAEVMGMMGINTKEMAWQNLNGTQKIEAMAKAFTSLSGAANKTVSGQAAVVSSVIASRWQINRFDVLMRDIVNVNGYYQKALKSTTDAQTNFNQKQRELNAVLSSNPQRLKQIWIMLQNAMANVIQPMIPVILMLANTVAKAANWFQTLSPEVQKFAIFSLLALAAIGPLARYIGSVGVLLGLMGEVLGFVLRGVFNLGKGLWWLVSKPFEWLAKGIGKIPSIIAKIGPWLKAFFTSTGGTLARAGTALVGIISWPFTAAVAAVLGILFIFRDQLVLLWNKLSDDFSALGENISDVFWSLPESITGALTAVVKVVQTAAMKVYELFSYLNPFAKHSPSLVEQVTKGMAVIRSQYASVDNVASLFAKAASDIIAYKRAIGSMTSPWADERADVSKYFNSALPLFDSLISDLKKLNVLLAQQEVSVSRQQAVVDGWKAKLDDANAVLDAQETKLSSLQDQLSALTEAYQEHKDALEAYAQAPLVGMGEMEDAIFANEQAQKALRLEIMKWEDANGSIEDMQNSMSLLAGSIEMMKGEVSGLISAGAGSDITGPMQDQIDAMQAAYDGMSTTISNSPVSDMQAELERLQRAGEELNLEQSLKFDELQRQIDQLVNTTKELTFEEIVAGIEKERAAMSALQPSIDAATEAIKQQQASVDAAKASRDALQATYDAESAKLSVLQAQYDKTAEMVRQVEAALNSMASAAADAGQKAKEAAQGAKEYLTPGGQNFQNAAGSSFPDVGGTSKIGREGGLGDQSAEIDKWTKKLQDDLTKAFDGFDVFGPLKQKWEDFKKWWEINVTRNWIRFTNDLKETWSAFSDSFANNSFVIWVKDMWEKVSGFIGEMVTLFKDDFGKIGKELGKVGDKLKQELGPELEKFKEVWPQIKQGIEMVWTWIKVIAGVIGVVLVGAFKIVTSILSHVLGPAIDFVIGLFKAVIKIVRGVVEILVGLFTGDLSKVVQGVKDIFWGIVNGIGDVLKNGWNLIWGIVEGLINGIIDWFSWLKDKLVGHSIIPDMINAIIDWFKGLPGKIWNAIISAVNFVVDVAKKMWDGFTSKSKELWNGFISWAGGLAQSVWNKIIALKDKLVDVAKRAWEAYKAKNIEVWNTVITWIKGLPQAVWDKIIAIKDKLIDVAKKAWDAYKSKSIEIWATVITWLKGLPQAAWDKVIGIKDKLVSAASDAFTAMKQKMQDLWDGKNGIMTWIKSLPQKVADAFKSIGSTVANAIKGAWNSAAGWINDHGISNVNSITSKFGVTIPKLPTFEGGGVIPGKISRRDNTIIAARTGEGVIVPELVRALGGSRGLNMMNAAAKNGNTQRLRDMGIQGFADGGVVGTAKGIFGNVLGLLQRGAGDALGTLIKAIRFGYRVATPGESFLEKWMDGKVLKDWQDGAYSWGEKVEAQTTGGLGGGALPQHGYQWQEKVLRAKFGKNIDFYSDWRPGAITALGNVSMHAMGRAVDMTPRKDIFDWIRGTYGKNTAQLFWSPEDGRTLLRGKPWHMDAVTKKNHWDHIHWGYDKGGILPPGSTLAYNGTGKNEYTLTNADWQTLSNVVLLLDRITQKSTTAGAGGGSAMARMGYTLASLEGRLRAIDTQSSTSTQQGSGSGNTYNFYGDLEFPNVRSGEDAEDFLKHLKGLGG